MALAFRPGDHRVVVELLEVLGWCLLDGAVRAAGAKVGPGGAPEIPTPDVGRQEATGVCSDDFEARELVESALEDEMRQGDSRLERIADDVAQISIALEPMAKLHGGRVALRVNKNCSAQLLSLCPEWVEPWIADLIASNATADVCTAQAVLLDALLELLGCQVGKLERHRRERNEPVWMGGTRLGKFLVLDCDDLFGKVAVCGFVPIGIDAERLHVNPLLVHACEPGRQLSFDVEIGTQLRSAELQVHQRKRFWHRAMGVDIDRPGTLAIDHDLSAPCLGPRENGNEVAANEQQACQRTWCCLQNVPTGGHLGLLHLRSPELLTASCNASTDCQRMRLADFESERAGGHHEAVSIDCVLSSSSVPQASRIIARVKGTCGQLVRKRRAMGSETSPLAISVDLTGGSACLPPTPRRFTAPISGDARARFESDCGGFF